MTSLTFDNLNWLHLLWGVLAVALLGVYAIWQRRRALQRFAALELLGIGAQQTASRAGEQGRAPISLLRPVFKLALLVLSLVALVGAMIGPRYGEAQQTIIHRGVDVMVLLDVSRSMLARDIVPNRLERAKLSIRDDLLPALGGDRIGIIAFAGVPSLRCPLTNDYGFARLALDDISPDSVPRGGTMIGDAIRMAQTALNDGLDTHKIVLLITDGEDQESYPVEAAEALWEKAKIPIVAVALGDQREGARIPVAAGRGEQYMTYKGAEVRTRANFEILRKIAKTSGMDLFVGVGTRNFDLGEIYRKLILPHVKYREATETETIPRPTIYHRFAAAALGLLLLDSLIRPSSPKASAAALLRLIRKGAA